MAKKPPILESLNVRIGALLGKVSPTSVLSRCSNCGVDVYDRANVEAGEPPLVCFPCYSNSIDYRYNREKPAK